MPEPVRAFDYGQEFGAVYHGARKLPADAQEWISRIRSEKLQHWISPKDRVLEYGVGFGWNLAALKCGEKAGFDLTPDLRSEVESKGIRFTTSEDSLAAFRFDKIVAHHVLEHVPSPAASLKFLQRLLTAGGSLLLFVPFERERKYSAFRADDRAHHLYSWTLASLSSLVAETGWKIEHTQINRFRFDRKAAIIARKLRGGFNLYRIIRRTGLVLFPEFELFLSARKLDS
jgi:SAM-dependent methyltransferase